MRCSFVAAAVMLAAAVAGVQGLECSALRFSGFCNDTATKFPAGFQVDGGFGLFTELFEEAMATSWATYRDAFDAAVERAGAQPCAQCVEAVRRMMCATVSPKCGYLNCWISVAQQAVNCIQDCDCTQSNAAQPGCYQCVQNCYANIMIGACSQYMMSRSTCSNFARVCGCVTDQSTIDSVCMFFEADGFTVDLTDLADCSSSNGWCADRKRSESPSCVKVPGGCLAATQSAGPASGTASNPFSNAESDSAAGVLHATVALSVLAALLALVF